MKFARHVLEYIAARAILALLALLPLSLATRIAMFVSRALFASLPRLRRIGLRNLELALPNLSLAERRRLLNNPSENLVLIFPNSRIFRAQTRPILPLGVQPPSLQASKTATAPPNLPDGS